MTQERFNAQMEEEFCSELEMMGKKVSFNNLEFNPCDRKWKSTRKNNMRRPTEEEALKALADLP